MIAGYAKAAITIRPRAAVLIFRTVCSLFPSLVTVRGVLVEKLRHRPADLFRFFIQISWHADADGPAIQMRIDTAALKRGLATPIKGTAAF